MVLWGGFVNLANKTDIHPGFLIVSKLLDLSAKHRITLF